MSIGGWLFAAVYDRLTAAAEAAGLSKRCEALLAAANGRVLEIGAGTGANLAFYPDAVHVDPCGAGSADGQAPGSARREPDTHRQHR